MQNHRNLTRETLKVLEEPRCGEKDDQTTSYDTFTNRSKTYNLTITVEKWSDKISKEVQKKYIDDAVRWWNNFVSIEVHWTGTYADINILFTNGNAI